MFVDVANAYKTRGVEAIGVSEDIAYESLKDADEAWQRVTPFGREHHVPYPFVMGDSRVTKDFNIDALPQTYLLDKRGRVAKRYVGIVERNNLEANLEALLAEPQ